VKLVLFDILPTNIKTKTKTKKYKIYLEAMGSYFLTINLRFHTFSVEILDLLTLTQENKISSTVPSMPFKSKGIYKTQTSNFITFTFQSEGQIITDYYGNN
jgi:hypothetical protein